MDAWIGLAGVIAGALIAFSGQYLLRRSEKQERSETLLLEQAALIVALSEDFRNRVWEERNNIATDVVGAWDIGSQRLAEARLRILSGDPEILDALEKLHWSGQALGRAWRLEPREDQAVDAAWVANRQAIEHFVTASSRAQRHGSIRRGRLETQHDQTSQPDTAQGR